MVKHAKNFAQSLSVVYFFISLLQHILQVCSVSCNQGRIIHCAGCTMVGAPAVRGRRSTAKFLPHCVDVWTCSVGRLKRNDDGDDKKRSLTFRGKKSALWERKSWVCVWEKGPALRWYGAPEWLIRPWLEFCCTKHQILFTPAFGHVYRCDSNAFCAVGLFYCRTL